MFQLESPGQMNLSTRLGPRKLSDLVAQISLFRPGPVRGDLVTPYVRRANGRESYSLPVPELEEVLGRTRGVMVFQEQVLEVCHKVSRRLRPGRRRPDPARHDLRAGRRRR